MVTIDKERIPVRTVWEDDGSLLAELEGEKSVILNTNWRVGEPMMLAEINGKEVSVQVATLSMIRICMCVW